MFRWFSKPKPIDVVSVDIANARAHFQKLRLQLDQVGTRTALSYRQVVVEVSYGLAHAFWGSAPRARRAGGHERTKIPKSMSGNGARQLRSDRRDR
jgi:hypothetical protein